MYPAIQRPALPARAPSARAPGSARPDPTQATDDGETASTDATATTFNDAVEAYAETMRERNLVLALWAEQRKHDDELLKKSIALIA